jgi:transmembrane sensor
MEARGKGSMAEVVKEATEWLGAMKDEAEHFDRQEWVAWLKASPQHVRQFLFASAISQELGTYKPKQSIDVRQLVEDSRNVLDWPDTAPPHSKGVRVVKRTELLKTVAAVAALILVSAAGLWGVLSSDKILSTAIGEQRAVRLADGSVIHLNTDSRVAIHFTDSARDVRLIRGEALFTVQRDRDRPFRVHTDSVTLQAIGTQFNVYRRTGEKEARETIVSVIEGHVAVLASPAIVRKNGDTAERAIDTQTNSTSTVSHGRAEVLTVLAAGEQARVPAEGTLEHHRMDNVADATAWRQRQLVFLDTPLAQIAAEIGRYTAVPKLDIQGEAVRARHVTAAFPADDVESLIQFFERDPQLSVTRHGDTVVIQARSPSTTSELVPTLH